MDSIGLSRRQVAIEKDEQMVSRLSERFANEISQQKLKIITGDILKVALPSFDICVANIPYYVRSLILLVS